MGGVEDRQLYAQWGEPPFGSTRAWAEHELGLSHRDTEDAYDLWRLMVTASAASPPVPLEVWTAISKGKAQVVRRAVRALVPVAEVVAAALAARTEDDLREWVAGRTGTELPWRTIELRLPAATAELLEAAQILTLRELPDVPALPDVAAARALVQTREWEHRTIEALAKSYVFKADAA